MQIGLSNHALFIAEGVAMGGVTSNSQNLLAVGHKGSAGPTSQELRHT